MPNFSKRNRKKIGNNKMAAKEVIKNLETRKEQHENIKVFGVLLRTESGVTLWIERSELKTVYPDSRKLFEKLNKILRPKQM